MTSTLGIIGAGNMAEAIVRGAIEAGMIEPSAVVAADPSAERRNVFASFGVATTQNASEVLAVCDRLLLAVKPQVFGEIAPVLGHLPNDRVVISIMAGVRHAKLAAATSPNQPVIRVMPNTPLLVGLGMSALSPNDTVTPVQLEWATRLFEAAGKVVVVDESLMDAVTAVSGSGPAYVFYLAEAMTRAADELGLSPEHATLLAQQTLLGAATMMTTTGVEPAELRRRVTSPGGTTQAAIEHLDASGVVQHLVEAIKTAATRSEQLGRD